MARLEMVRHPDPRLEQPSAPVPSEDFGPELEQRYQDMLHTMRAEKGIGLAGVQVGDMRRILVATVGGQPGFYANPTIKAHGDKVPSGFKEGCLSYPKLNVNVHRYAWIDLEWQDAMGETHTQRFTGMDAIVLQHEMDHLDGVTILQQASPTKRRSYGPKTPRRRPARRKRRR